MDKWIPDEDRPRPQMDKWWQLDRQDQYNQVYPCYCVGPQPGETKCPCLLRHDATRNTATIGHVENTPDEPHLTETNPKPEAKPMKSLNTQLIEELCVLAHEQSVLIGLLLNGQLLGEMDVGLALKHVARVLKVQSRIRKLMEEKDGS